MVTKAIRYLGFLGFGLCILGVALSGSLIGLGVWDPLTVGTLLASLLGMAALVSLLGIDLVAS
jgi:hypothetical protein